MEQLAYKLDSFLCLRGEAMGGLSPYIFVDNDNTAAVIVL
jgi:hypothetical protein